jgi:uncharacterized membrane protein YidH (DUF202 family)
MSSKGGRGDLGLQPERTALAWRRTALALAVTAAAGSRVLFPVLGAVGAVAAAGGVVAAAGLWVASVRRYRQASRCLAAESGCRLPGAALLGVVAAVVTAVGALGVLFLFAAPR